MIKTLLFDFSRTLLFPKDKSYDGGLNDLYNENRVKQGFNFLEYFELNKDLLDYLESIKSKIDLYIFTSESIQNDPAIKDDLAQIFKKVFSAKEIGLSKKDPKSYEFISKELDLNPNEILFIDDSQDNLESAKVAGLQILHFRDNSVINDLMPKFEK